MSILFQKNRTKWDINSNTHNDFNLIFDYNIILNDLFYFWPTYNILNNFWILFWELLFLVTFNILTLDVKQTKLLELISWLCEQKFINEFFAEQTN